MEESEFQQVKQEVRDLRAEVRRTRHLIEGTVVILAVGLVTLFPNLLVVAIALVVFILFVIGVRP